MALYLLHDGDYHLQSPLSVRECAAMTIEQLIGIFHSYENRRSTMRYMLTDRLLEQLDAAMVSKEETEELHDCVLVTTAFESLNCRAPFDAAFWQGLLDRHVTVVPLPFGFAYDSACVQGTLTKDIAYILGQMAERCPIAVQGDRTAELLAKQGIRNVCLIGSPALYDFMRRRIRLELSHALPRVVGIQRPEHFWGGEWRYLFYFVQKHRMDKLDVRYAAQHSFMTEMTKLAENAGRQDAVLRMYLDKGLYCFSADDWLEKTKEWDFCMGPWFYTNAAAILGGVPALTVTGNPCTEELVRLHGLPYIAAQDFDDKKPVEYYYEMCANAPFNRVHADNWQRYLAYCSRNGVKFRMMGEGENNG